MVHTVSTEDAVLDAWDLGGMDSLRHLWTDYAQDPDLSAVLFWVEASSSRKILEQARDEVDY